MTDDTLLLVDNSNTRTKFAFARQGKLCGETLTLPTAQISPQAVQDLLAGHSYARAILCSVVPKAAEILLGCLGAEIHRISAATCPTFLRHYPGQATLGADRIANAAAAAALYPLPCVAVDLGTACTFDVVVSTESGPGFLGGVIAPGLQSLAAAPTRTAQLPATSTATLSTAAAIGRDTRSALRAGLSYGYAGMLTGILEGIAKELGATPHVVITGGDTERWTPPPAFPYSIDKNLTFKGMLELDKIIR